MANRKTQKKRTKHAGPTKRIGLALVVQQGRTVTFAGVEGPLATSLSRALMRAGGVETATLPKHTFMFADEAKAATVFNESFSHVVGVSDGIVWREDVIDAEALAALEVNLGAVL